MKTFLFGKRSSSNLQDSPAKKIATEEQEIKGPELEEGPDKDDDIEIETAEEVLETITPHFDQLENEAEDKNKGSEANPLEREDIKEVVKASLIAALKDPEAVKLLSDEIAHRIQNLDKKETEVDIDENVWMNGEDYISCIPCLKHADNDKVPANLRKSKKGNFGRLKASADRFNIRSSQKKHEATDLHKWCNLKSEELEKEKIVQEMKNKQASENTVRNVIFALKNGGGSELYLSLMDKDNLTEGIEAPTKNDSKRTFFDLREVVYEEVDRRVKKLFRDVKYITVTLDKVTVGHVYYMVILTYFFHEGQIFICLNRLEKLQEDNYDGPGTAAMLVKVLRDTLGWSRPQLADRLIHMTYDGVFAETSERVRGGGSLSLRTHVCAELGLEAGSISGDWDAANLG